MRAVSAILPQLMTAAAAPWTPPAGTVLWLSAAKSGSIGKLGTWPDQSGVGNNCVLYADAQVTGGRLVVDGTGDYGLAGTMGNFGSGMGADGSVAFWVKTSTTAISSVCGTFADGTTTALRCDLNKDNAGNNVSGLVTVFLRAETMKNLRARATVNANDGAWHHMALAWSCPSGTSSATIWVDGVSKAVTYDGGGNVQDDTRNTANLQYPMCIAGVNARGTIIPSLAAEYDGYMFSTARWVQADIDDIFANSPDKK